MNQPKTYVSAATILTIITLLFAGGSTPTETPQPSTPQIISVFFHSRTINIVNESIPMSTNNLARIPQDWDLTYGSGAQIIFLDYAITRSSMPSIRVERHVDGVDTNHAREVDGIWYNIQPGDHIVAKCWMKTEASGLGDTNPYSGARIGLDFYGPSGRITGLQSNYGFPETDQGVQENYVPWGTGVWTLRTIEVTVPNTIVADGALGYSAGTLVVPTSVVMWMQVWSSLYGGTDPGKAWFADAELYINTTPPITPPPAAHYHVTLWSSAGGSTSPANNTFTVLVGQNFSATATPNADYTVEWYLNSVLVSTDYTYSFSGLADATYSLLASFVYHAPVEPPEPPIPPATSFSVNVGVAAGGTTSVVGVQNVLTTSSLSVTAAPATNYVFSYWLKDNANAGSANPIVVTGIASQTITLRPVFTYVPPQPSPVDPAPGTPVAIAGPLDDVFAVLEAVNIPTINDIFDALERTVF